MSKSFSMAYGKKEVSVSLENLDLLDVIKIKDIPPLTEPETALKEALAKPWESLPLRDRVRAGETVAVIVNDDTRVANTPFFLPTLLEEIKAGGVAGEDISIVFANGTHRLLPEETQRQLIGAEVYNKYTIINHDCRDRENLVYVGTTSRGNRVEINRQVAEADRVVLTGSIVYHFFAGYGGGRKALMPGVAGYETILFNHSLMLQEGAELARLEGNPVHEDILEAVSFVKPDFLLNAVLNEKKDFLGFFAGDYLAAHAEGCKLVDKAYGVPLPKKAELVIASCGGYPKDLNLYQAQKTLDNAIRAVVSGGVVILLAACPEGLGSSVLEEWLEKYCSPQEICEAVQKEFVIGGHKAYALTRLTETAHIIMVSDLPPALVEKIYYKPAGSLQEALEMAQGFLGKEKPTTYLMPQGSLTLPLV